MSNFSVIYKYVSIDGAKSILKNNSIKLTPPNEFNDPFELLGEKIIGFDLNSAKNAVKQLPIDDIINSLNHPEEYKSILRAANKAHIVPENIRKNITSEDSALEYLKFIVDALSKSIGIVCLTKNNKNVLMWSHYADQHKGAVIGFDGNKLSNKIFKVNYGLSRVKIKYGQLNNPENVLPLFLRKSIDWEYEDEYRCFYDLNSCIKIKNDDSKSGFLYLQSLPDGAIEEIVFGCRVSQEDKDSLLQIINEKYNAENIRLRQASIHNTEFSINIK